MADGADTVLCWEGTLLEEFCGVEKTQNKVTSYYIYFKLFFYFIYLDRLRCLLCFS